MTNSDVLKKEFEKFMVKEFLYLIKTFDNNPDGTYWDTVIQNYWEAYQSAWKTSREKNQIELPRNYTISEIEDEPDPNIQQKMIARNEAIDNIWEILEQQGFKVKESQK
ncbi:hypothetical protein [Xenorhabdus indica]|uniref:hypothetical protein n=1 Tax=Xenorhabdus indica TaxID=333964 RepID=UPI0016571E9B|nr:hypothetical protein [Xenorhabdus indica]MBC8947037.1 hypothetical protein [Xenorhabdus indica]